MSAPHAELRRVTRREHDDDLRCDVRRPLAWIFECRRGCTPKFYGSRGAALAGKREHEAEHRTP